MTEHAINQALLAAGCRRDAMHETLGGIRAALSAAEDTLRQTNTFSEVLGQAINSPRVAVFKDRTDERSAAYLVSARGKMVHVFHQRDEVFDSMPSGQQLFARVNISSDGKVHWQRFVLDFSKHTALAKDQVSRLCRHEDVF